MPSDESEVLMRIYITRSMYKCKIIFKHIVKRMACQGIDVPAVLVSKSNIKSLGYLDPASIISLKCTNKFQGDLTVVSAETKALIIMRYNDVSVL